MFSSEFWWFKDKVTEGRAWWERCGQVGSVEKLVCKREEGFESLCGTQSQPSEGRETSWAWWHRLSS